MSLATSQVLSYGNLQSVDKPNATWFSWLLMYSLHYDNHYMYSVCCCNFHLVTRCTVTCYTRMRSRQWIIIIVNSKCRWRPTRAVVWQLAQSVDKPNAT